MSKYAGPGKRIEDCTLRGAVNTSGEGWGQGAGGRTGVSALHGIYFTRASVKTSCVSLP